MLDFLSVLRAVGGALKSAIDRLTRGGDGVMLLTSGALACSENVSRFQNFTCKETVTQNETAS